MNKSAKDLYGRVLAALLDEMDVSEDDLFNSNSDACVLGRAVLITRLAKRLTNAEIAELIPLSRCSVCRIRSHFNEDLATWSVRQCIKVADRVLEEFQ